MFFIENNGTGETETETEKNRKKRGAQIEFAKMKGKDAKGKKRLHGMKNALEGSRSLLSIDPSQNQASNENASTARMRE